MTAAVTVAAVTVAVAVAVSKEHQALRCKLNQPFTPLFAVCLLLAGCGGGGDASDPPPLIATPFPEQPATGLWIASTNGEGLSAFKGKLTTLVTTDRALTTVDSAPAQEGAGGGYSMTYTVEPATDEYDIVKYDGSTLAIAPSRSGCCFILEDMALPAEDAAIASETTPTDAEIRLFQTDPSAGNGTFLTRIPLEEGYRTEGMYLVDNALQVLLSTAWWGAFGARLIEPDYWEANEVRLDTYDLTDPSQPVLRDQWSVEGVLVSSRRRADHIYLISRHTPVIEGLVPYPSSEEEIANNEAVLADVTDQDILPAMSRNDEAITPLTLDDCYRQDPEHPLANERPADPIITTVLMLSATSGEVVEATCAMESVDGVYLGDSFIALSFVEWHTGSDQTLIHVLDRDDLSYIGSESVGGALYSGGNADFRISEFEGALRLVTTRWTGDADDQFRHVLYTLKPDASAPELSLLASLGDRTDPRLGKINEDLYGVRFMGPKAYLVTFERIDPLYVVDLADPEAPRILGELEVSGFSDLLHEVNGELLLGLGQSETRLPKLELFDISDTSAPVSRSLIEIGTGYEWAYSPAQYNRYAFTYLEGEDSDRLSVPYSAAVRNEQGYTLVDRIALFEINNKEDAQRASIASVGEVTLRPGSVSDDTRVIIDAEALYVVAQSELMSGFWSNPEALQRLPTD